MFFIFKFKGICEVVYVVCGVNMFVVLYYWVNGLLCKIIGLFLFLLKIVFMLFVFN